MQNLYPQAASWPRTSWRITRRHFALTNATRNCSGCKRGKHTAGMWCNAQIRCGLLLIVLYHYHFMVRWIISSNSQYLFLSGSASHPVSPWSCLRRGEAKLQLATVRRQLRQENADEESSAEDQQLGGAVRQRRARLRRTIHRCLRSERSLLRRHTGL